MADVLAVRDEYRAQQWAMVVQECRSSGMTVVIITHNKALCAMADRVVHIKSGTVQSVEKNERVVPVEDIEW